MAPHFSESTSRVDRLIALHLQMINLTSDKFFCLKTGVRMRLFLIATFFTNAIVISFAQSPLPQFEIATIKSPGPQDRIIHAVQLSRRQSRDQPIHVRATSS
jgi:hypothetical protein